jgi:hypothetical protein
MAHVNEHGSTVDVADLEMAQFRIPHAGRVQDHQQGSFGQGACRRDQTLDLVDGQHRGQPAWDLRIRRVVEQVAPPEPEEK